MDLGLPEDWDTLKAWIQPSSQGYTTSQHLEGERKQLSHPEILLLADYSGLAPKEFWAAFPSYPLPAGPTTSVRVDRLKILIRRFGTNWSGAKNRVARRAIKNLSRGGETGV